MGPISPAQVALLDANVDALLPRLDLGKLHGQRIFITGGTGFFGLWLLTALRALRVRKVQVQVCVLTRDPSVFLARFGQFRGEAWLDFLKGNVRDFKFPDQQFDHVIHAATETTMAAHADPARMFDDILLGTRRTLDMAQHCGARRVLHISSGAVYGPQPPGMLHRPEDSMQACDPLVPRSAYGEGKRVMELLGAICQQRTGIDSVVTRGYAFSGPGLPLDGHFAIGNFVRDALYREEITVLGDGMAVRSYLHGADLALWLLDLLLHAAPGHSYHVGSDEALSIRDLAVKVRDVLAPGKPVLIKQAAGSEAGASYVPAISRARALGLAPWTSLTESLLQMASYERAHAGQGL